MRLLKAGETTCSCDEKQTPGWFGKVRRDLMASAQRRFGSTAPWVRRHAAHCPRCQQRLAGLTRVDIALSIIKSQPHRLDLLMRANNAAIHMLSRQLRETAEAAELREAKPEPSLAERCAGRQNALVNVAACFAVLVLTKAGIFTSLDKARTCGQAAMKQYYTDQAGEDLAGEIFKS